MATDDPALLRFLGVQTQDYGGQLEIDPGLWALFAVAAADEAGQALARSLLANAPFAHHVGLSADDRWMLFYIDSANRPAAVFWLEDLARVTAGAVRPVSPAQLALIRKVITTDQPHRAAQQLAELHSQGEISAGVVREPADVRSLLDRLHAREPLFFAAFQSLLSHHLIDMVVLLQQLIPEDVELKNEIVKAGLSRDPFLQNRQDAAAEIRHTFIRFHVINPLDQQKNLAITNPYAAFLEIIREDETITAPIDGINIPLPRGQLLEAIRQFRLSLGRGETPGSLNTHTPWVNQEIAYAVRFIKQQLDAHRDLAPLDLLYMLERSVAA